MIRSLFLSISKDLKNKEKFDTMPLTDVSRQNDSTTNLLNGSTLPINATPIRLNRNDQGQYIRAKLRYFFMSPCWKWHLKRRCPWKAWFQILKIIVLTIQV